MTSIASYADLIAVLRAARLELGMNQMDLDDRAGFQAGYSGKLEAFEYVAGRRKAGTKQIGWANFFNWVEAVGLEVQLVRRDARPSDAHVPLDRLRQRVLEPHLENFALRRRRVWAVKNAALGGRKGAAALNAKLGKRGRKRAAKRAAMARWKRKANNAGA